jgi:hypothetical protein
MDDIHRILAHAKKNKEGFTAYYRDGKLTKVEGTKQERYSVADKTAIIYVPKDRNIQVYSMPRNNTYVGGWYDKETGRYLIENIDLYSSRTEALRVARKRKQKAIFDLLKMNEIQLQYKKRVSGVRIKKRWMNPVVKRKKRYYNTITGKYVSKNTAIRFNTYFKKHPGATLYEAMGRPVYDKDKPWIDQSDNLHSLLKKRKVQVIKTKNRHGKTVYFNPLLGKRITKEHVTKALKYDYHKGQFYVQLYRMTTTKDRVYHIITTNIDKTLEETDDIDKLFNRLKKSWMHEAKELIEEIHRQHSLSNVSVIYITFDHDIIMTNYNQKDNGAVIIMKNRQPNKISIEDFSDELEKARITYKALLIRYRLIMVKKVRIFIYCFATHQNKALSELRLGVYKRNGD